MAILRDAFSELGRLLRRRPAQDQGWRDYWVVMLTAFAPFFVVLMLIDPPLLSVAMLALVVGAAGWGFLVMKVLTRLGVIGPRAAPTERPAAPE